MAVNNALFVFEVVVEKFLSYVESRFVVIKSDFADIFSLELRDPKTMHIVIPEPPPLPPEPPGKKKKKPKPKKPKKGKGPPPEPPEPEILAGQSVLFTSSPEVLLQNMKKNPMQISLWSKEDTLRFIGACNIPWDPVFLLYLDKLIKCQTPPPPTAKDEYNIFEEKNATLMAKIKYQVKLSYLTDKVTTSFRTLSEEPDVKKLMYTGINSKTTSFMCTLKTTDEEYTKNMAKMIATYNKDKIMAPPPRGSAQKPVYASFQNAPGAKLSLFSDGDYCCMGNAQKVPEDKYAAPDQYPSIDFICDYVKKIITSCNDNMRMLTPRPTIRQTFKASDMDKLCYCRETGWPQGDLAERFKKETQGGPCPVCVRELDGKPRPGTAGAKKTVLDIANIRGPCGRPDCRIARDIRAYLENLVEEDNKEICLDDIIGPCGSKSCTLVDRIKDFLRHEGKFAHGKTIPGLPTQCSCIEQMQKSLIRTGSCESICSHDCESSSDYCGGKGCPFKDPANSSSSGVSSKGSSKTNDKDKRVEKVYYVYYFTVEYDKTPPSSPPASTTSGTQNKSPPSGQSSSPATAQNKSPPSGKSTPPATTTSGTHTSSGSPTRTTPHTGSESQCKYKYCAPTCPTASAFPNTCSKSVCNVPYKNKEPSMRHSLRCIDITCPHKEADKQSAQSFSPADSNIELNFDEIRNPCCVKSCDIAEKVKGYIVEGLAKKHKKRTDLDPEKDPCYCDCDCTFEMTGKTTYCGVCGGYECLGDDVKAQPDYLQPYPCPLYHKMYNKKMINTDTPLPEEEKDKEKDKTGKTSASKTKPAADSKTESKNDTGSIRPTPKGKQTKSKFTAPQAKASAVVARRVDESFHPFDFVPKNMGWLWNAEDIPGLKHRPKWKPGATTKYLVRKYRAVREGADVILKKKRALMNKRKKVEMKPTLLVTKKDGEYTVQMEVFKKYSKERMRYQYPYDEKPPLIYTIGKTEEVKAKLQRQKERKERRENRRKCRMLQSTFRDKCQEICVKAYNQTIGLAPLPNPNNPECPCEIEHVKVPTPVIDSCSCSGSGSLSTSDTDGDDWVIEFTPPLAVWDTKAKHPPVLAERESQYNYLDYKVKCLDKSGNQVPRFFKGPTGSMECSDLGGFYGPDGRWLIINKDGFIAPDNRWVPMSFKGHDGETYSAEEGWFIDGAGKTWVVGCDGYVDEYGKWRFYGKRKCLDQGKSISTVTGASTGTKKTSKPDRAEIKYPGAHISHPLCKPEVKKQPPKAQPEPTKPIARAVATETDKEKKKVTLKSKSVVMSLATNNDRRQRERAQQSQYRAEPISKIEFDKISKYQDILEGMQMYDDVVELRPPQKTNRAVDTRQSKQSINNTRNYLVPNPKNTQPGLLPAKKSSFSARRY